MIFKRWASCSWTPVLHFQIRFLTCLAASAWLTLSSPAALVLSPGFTTTTENFNGLGTSGTAFPVAGVPFVAWDTDRTDAVITTMTSDNGSSTANGLRNLGNTADRALGSRAAGGGQGRVPAFGLNIQNNTGSTISAFTISYRRELWRTGSSSATDVWNFQYAVVSSAITMDNSAATWLDFNALDMYELNPTLTSNTAVDGNASGNFATVSASFNVPLNNGQFLAFRWLDSNNAGQDSLMAVDDLVITAVPEPVNLALGIFATGTVFALGLRHRQTLRSWGRKSGRITSES